MYNTVLNPSDALVAKQRKFRVCKTAKPIVSALARLRGFQVINVDYKSVFGRTESNDHRDRPGTRFIRIELVRNNNSHQNINAIHYNIAHDIMMKHGNKFECCNITKVRTIRWCCDRAYVTHTLEFKIPHDCLESLYLSIDSVAAIVANRIINKD